MSIIQIYFKNGRSHGVPSGQFVFESVCSGSCDAVAANDHCDAECNTVQCLYDGDDCDNLLNNSNKTTKSENFYHSIDFTNVLFNKYFNVDQRNIF